jgi:hypothetical protein
MPRRRGRPSAEPARDQGEPAREREAFPHERLDRRGLRQEASVGVEAQLDERVHPTDRSDVRNGHEAPGDRAPATRVAHPTGRDPARDREGGDRQSGEREHAQSHRELARADPLDRAAGPRSADRDRVSRHRVQPAGADLRLQGEAPAGDVDQQWRRLTQDRDEERRAQPSCRGDRSG